MNATQVSQRIATATPTAKGRELMDRLLQFVPWHRDLSSICSIICRNGVTYCRLQVERCNGDWIERQFRGDQNAWDAYIMQREEAIEHFVSGLVSRLKTTDGKPLAVAFSGDPRGATIRLVMPDGREISVPGA